MILIKFTSTILDKPPTMVHTGLSILRAHESKLKAATRPQFACKHVASFSRWILINQDVLLSRLPRRAICVYLRLSERKIQSRPHSIIWKSPETLHPFCRPVLPDTRARAHTHTCVVYTAIIHTIAQRFPQSFTQMCLRISSWLPEEVIYFTRNRVIPNYSTSSVSK